MSICVLSRLHFIYSFQLLTVLLTLGRAIIESLQGHILCYYVFCAVQSPLWMCRAHKLYRHFEVYYFTLVQIIQAVVGD